MNKLTVLVSILLSQILLFTACDNDDVKDIFGDNSKDVPTAILDKFITLYPHAKYTKWEVENGFAKAEFHSNEMTGMTKDNHNTKAWFSIDKNMWEMTEFEMKYNSLPAAIKEAFEQTEFAKVPWRTDDEIEKIIRENNPPIYIINVEREENDNEVEIDLVYAENGILINKKIDMDGNDHSDYLPETISDVIKNWLKLNYPNAQIVDIDVESDHIEVEFIDGKIKREAVFNLNNNWLYTETETRYYLLPDIVQLAFKASAYAKYEVDDVNEYITNSNIIYYGLELETENDRDIEIFISADGKIITDKAPW